MIIRNPNWTLTDLNFTAVEKKEILACKWCAAFSCNAHHALLYYAQIKSQTCQDNILRWNAAPVFLSILLLLLGSQCCELSGLLYQWHPVEIIPPKHFLLHTVRNRHSAMHFHNVILILQINGCRNQHTHNIDKDDTKRLSHCLGTRSKRMRLRSWSSSSMTDARGYICSISKWNWTPAGGSRKKFLLSCNLKSGRSVSKRRADVKIIRNVFCDDTVTFSG